PCGSRPAPEGAGAGAEQGHSAGGGGWCRHCHTKLAELKRQAWKLVSGPGTRLRDPCLSALLPDKLPAPGVLPVCRPEVERHCDVCATHLTQLTREALRLLQAPASLEDLDTLPGGPGLMPPSPGAMTGPRDAPVPAGLAARQPGHAGPDRRKGLAWPSGPSVQVSVAPAGLGGALSTVTIQAQQCLEGMWSVSRVNSFLPPSCLAEAAVAAVAVADTVRDSAPAVGPGGTSELWGRSGACAAAPGPSAAASFFVRAAQKLSLAAKRKKPHPPPAPAARGTSTYPTDFSGVLQLWPPPAPPCLLRASSKAKDNPSSVGKVKVVLRVWPSRGAQRSAESASFLKVEPRKKQVTLYDLAAGPPGSAGPRRTATALLPKMFAFDAVYPQDSEQAEVCSGTVADVLQSVVSGADGCIFSFGHTSLGTSYTMIGRDSSPRSLGVVPCAISWLFRLIEARRERTGARFSVRVSAVEVCGRGQSLRDLLAGVASGSLQDAQSPGVGSWAGCGEDARHSSHMLFTLHVYQYRMEKAGKGAMSGGRSRLHLIDLGSCEGAPGRGTEAPGGPLCLSLSALGSVILALVSGAKHVPYREHRLTMLLRESLATTHCHTTMIAHISDEPARHAETLSTAQLAARIHRLRRKKVKYASSSSGGDSSCEEGHVRRPLRPFHPRPGAPDPDRLASGSPGDPDYSSGSEQSCDTVIYVGPGGAALSDRELTDGEGPPDFVPIIPALSRRPPSRGPRDADHFRCSTFAELQERLECIDGSEGPAGAPASRKTSLPDAPAPRTAAGAPLAASTAHGSPSPDSHRGALEPSQANSEQTEANSVEPEPSVPDKATGAGGRRPLPSPAPPPGQPEAGRAPAEPRGGGADGLVRTPPVGMSGQGGQPRPPARGPLERGLLTTTVTLQQPVELNGEDELVFTVVEELSLGALAGPGRPASLASFGSDCSLQALASGSRPVSIISSVTDELDACAAQAPRGSPSSSISSWLSEVSVCTADGLGPAPSGASLDPSSPDCPAGPTPLGPPILDHSPEHRSFGSSEQDAQDERRSFGSSEQDAQDGPVPVAVAAPTRPGREPRAASPRGAAAAQTIHSSLPRRPRTTSAAGRAACPCLALSPPGPRGLFEDPWLLRGDACGPFQGASAARVPSPAPVPACGRRVVDGCEVVARAAPRPEAVAQIPLLRRGATTLGVTTPATSCGDAAADAVACPGSSKTTSKKSVAPKGGPFSRPAGASPPAPPVRRSSLEHRTIPAPVPLPAGAAALRGDEEARPSSRADHSMSRATSSLKARAGKAEATYRPAPHGSLERCEGLVPSSAKAKEVAGKPARAVPRTVGQGPRWALRSAHVAPLRLGLQRRRLIPAPLPDAVALGHKPGLPGQWVDLPPPLAGSRKEPFEIKVYEIDDVQRLQRHRPPLREDPAEGLACVSMKPRLAERRQQRLRDLQAQRELLCAELAETQGRLMVRPGRWLEQFEVDPELEPESAEYLVALERATAALEQHVNLCKAHVMMVTCFDIAVTTPATTPGPQEVDV
ncbi:Kinesin-like protein KIF26A, partial [Pteropus alecto]